jgi:type VI protein secretion system component VasK
MRAVKKDKTMTDMKTNVMQVVRLVMMIVAVAGVIYALEYMERGIAVWFWVTLLGIGFVGLLYTFRMTQRRMRLERRAKERQEKKRARKSKR